MSGHLIRYVKPCHSSPQNDAGRTSKKSKKTYANLLWTDVWISLFTCRQTRASLAFACAAYFLSTS